MEKKDNISHYEEHNYKYDAMLRNNTFVKTYRVYTD